MYFGGYIEDYETKEEIPVFFHRTEINEYKHSLTSRAGGVTLNRMLRLINEYKKTGQAYSVSSYIRLKLMHKGYFGL